MPTGGEALVAGSARPGRRGRVRPAGRAQPRRLEGASPAAGCGWSASGTSRPRATPPTATPGRPGGSASRSPPPGRAPPTSSPRSGRRGPATPAAGHRDRHPDRPRRPGAVPRRAARDHRPGVVLPAGHQGAAAGRVRRRPARAVAAGRTARAAAPAPAGLRRGPDRPAVAAAGAGEAPAPSRTSRRARASCPTVSALPARRPGGRWCGPAAEPPPTTPGRRSPPSPSGSARRCSPRTAVAGCCRPTTRCLVPLPPHARPRRARCGTPPTWWSWSAATSTRMNTQGFRQPRPPWRRHRRPGRARSNLEPDVHVPLPTRVAGLTVAAGAPAAGSARAPWCAAPGGSERVRRARRPPSWTRFEAGLPTDAVRRGRHVRRRLLVRRLRPGRAGRAGSPTRSAGGRSASASPPASARRCPAGRRSPWSATAASCSPAATSRPRRRSSCR